MITSQVQRKAVLAIVVMSFLMFTASFALAVSGGRPWPGSGCNPDGEMLSYLPPPYVGTITIEWLSECEYGNQCVFMNGDVVQVGNNECQASFSNYYLKKAQDLDEFMNLHPNDIIGLCSKNLKKEFPCHKDYAEVPGGGPPVPVGGIELVGIGKMQYIPGEWAFTASVVMMAVTANPK